MARRNPVPEREKTIAARLREVRKARGLTMTAFAEKAGVPHVRYVGYEYGHVPLTYVAAAKICERFGVSARWLAEGIEPRDLYFKPLTDPVSGNERIAFSKVYDDHLKASLESLAAQFDDVVAKLGPVVAPLLKRHAKERHQWRAKARAMLLDLVASVFDCTAHKDAREDASRDFMKCVVDSVHKFSAANPDLPVPEKYLRPQPKKKLRQA